MEPLWTQARDDEAEAEVPGAAALNSGLLRLLLRRRCRDLLRHGWGPMP